MSFNRSLVNMAVWYWKQSGTVPVELMSWWLTRFQLTIPLSQCFFGNKKIPYTCLSLAVRQQALNWFYNNV